MKISPRAAAVFFSALTVSALLTGCASNTPKAEGAAGLTTVQNEMYDAEYWASKHKKSSEILLNAEEIAKFNAQTIDCTRSMEDIAYYQTTITSTQLVSAVNEFVLPETALYSVSGELLYQPPEITVDEEGNEVAGETDTTYIDALLSNRALDAESLPSTSNVSYALALTNSSIRALPTSDQLFVSDVDRSVDLLRVSSFPIGEPMVVLHYSADSLWYFVQTRTCRGWVHWSEVVLVEKSEWLNYIHAENFLVVTDRCIMLPAQDVLSEPITLTMGTMLPLYEQQSAIVNGQSSDGNYIVKIPSKDSFGNFTYQLILVPMTKEVNVGYLDYTPENILTVAFRLAGQKLNTAGLNNGWDENSFFTSVFACFGIYLPLDIAQQKQIDALDTNLSLSAVKDISAALDNSVPGTLLYTDDSAALYLGKENGQYYVLYPATDFFIGETRYNANGIIITDMSILFENGSTYLNSIKMIKNLAVITAENTK